MTLFAIFSMFYTALIFFALILGLYFGSKKTEEIKLPNPVKIVTNTIDEVKDRKENQKQKAIDEINQFNIDNYDGTGIGQKDIPR